MRKNKNNVKRILFQGVFWRILAIEAILLVWSLIYRELTESPGIEDQFWYAMRIILLIGIIILFMMVTLQSFLTKKIISPLESIVSSNHELAENKPSAGEVNLPDDAPLEIKEIVSSRTKMLNTILTVSEERLRLVNFIRETFGRYLSKKVVDEILELPEGRKIGGRRETVTILMSDLRGFMNLSETRDPEELVRLLNRYLERMSKVILEHDGMIDEFIGDAILVVFGVPESRDDDALRAVACGLSMQNALSDLNKEITLEGYPPFEMGIGINTGTVIVGNIGSEARLKYGIVGAAVNTAGRIESNTVGGQVLIGESTYRLVHEDLTTEPPQTVMMKGMKRPMVNYPVKAIGPPYNIDLHLKEDNQNGIQLSLPFHCWKVEDKKIAGESCVGETIMLNENVIVASIKPPLEPLTDIKLKFDFCMEAHCFEDIYGKILPPTDDDDHSYSQLRITSINPVDRDILKKWMEEAG
jgi:class 3 adenylate cyclase